MPPAFLSPHHVCVCVWRSAERAADMLGLDAGAALVSVPDPFNALSLSDTPGNSHTSAWTIMINHACYSTPVTSHQGIQNDAAFQFTGYRFTLLQKA